MVLSFATLQHTGPKEEVHRQEGVVHLSCGAPVPAGQGQRGRGGGVGVRPHPVGGEEPLPARCAFLVQRSKRVRVCSRAAAPLDDRSEKPYPGILTSFM